MCGKCPARHISILRVSNDFWSLYLSLPTHLDSQINVAISRDYSELREGGREGRERTTPEKRRASLIQKGSETERERHKSSVRRESSVGVSLFSSLPGRIWGGTGAQFNRIEFWLEKSLEFWLENPFFKPNLKPQMFY